MIDLHAHPLPGLDDGAPDLAAGVALVEAAAHAGVTAIAATPHVRSDFPTTSAQMRAGVDALRDALAGIVPVDVATGAEVATSFLPGLDDDEIVHLTLGGSGRYLLVELPDYGWSVGIELSLQRLTGLGIRPVIAHPERNDLVQERPERMRPLVDAGAVLQITARTTVGERRPTADTSAALLRLGLVHLVASDAHSAPREGRRSPWTVALDEPLRELLCVTNPASILKGDDVQAAPPRGAGFRRLLRGGR